MTADPPALPRELAAALEEFAARGHVLVALDFDGVLAPIVVDRDAARPLPEASSALRRLADSPGIDVALVSGRTMADLQRLASPPPGITLIASHGGELQDPSGHGAGPLLDEATQTLLADVLADLDQIVAAHPGTALETKPAGGVVHTRRADRAVAADASAAVLSGPAARAGVHAMRGKEVVELSVLDTDKGRALTALRDRLGVTAVLYAGDDVTDENAFAVLRAGDMGIKVGDGDTLAAWRVADPVAFAALLHRLADLLDARPGPAGPSSA